jgi:tetratricopeptide (TPR) repeat protein
MNLEDCYRLLGLRSGASFEEIKASYRRLVRQYHPDVNPGNQQTQDKFIAITEAYKQLLAASSSTPMPERETRGGVKITRKATSASAPGTHRPPAAAVQFNANLSPVERQLKQSSYEQLQQLLREQRFPRAIALVEGLARRIPQDSEITQWQAIVYQRWGRYLIQQRQLDKARTYLKKALRTDPHNRSLWAEVEKDFRYLEQLF